MLNAVEQNGVAIARTPGGIGVAFTGQPIADVPLKIEVDYRGQRLKNEWLQPRGVLGPWRDYFGSHVNHLRCAIRVKQNGETLAELRVPSSIEERFPFMIRQGPQVHVTEAYVSVPPALTITDEVGAIFTLGMKAAPKELSPEGEFAFAVLRDAVDTGEIASRIERRNGKVRCFTRHGWRVWTGTSFF